MSKPLHITLVDNYLSTSRTGISTACAFIAGQMVERGHTVTVYTTKTWRRKSLTPLHEGVHLRFYTFTDNNLKIQKLRQEIRELNPDVCMPMFCDGKQLVWAVTLLGSGVPYLYTERCAQRIIEKEFWSRKGRLAAMGGADRIHLLLPEYGEDLPPFLQDIVRVIPNAAPVVTEQANPLGKPGERKRLLWLARLDDALKQCRVALDAFALIAHAVPEWDMHIVGNGKDARSIRRHLRKVGLHARVFLHGECHHALPHYLEAQLFCLSSRSEGFPNALLDAFACGLPAVGFAACTGVNSLIQHGENGLLAPEMTAQSFAASLLHLMQQNDERVRMGKNALNVSINYAQKPIADAWETLFYETAACKGHTVMDAFADEPFASMARLSSVARREWLWRDFGGLMPGTIEAWAYYKICQPCYTFWKKYICKNAV